jgi:hypothetical protein
MAIFQLDVSVGDLTLAAGEYWLQLREGAIGSPGDATHVFWCSTNLPKGSARSFALDEVSPTWQKGSEHLAFQLFDGTGDVPEPPTMAMWSLLGSILAAGNWRRRRNRTVQR